MRKIELSSIRSLLGLTVILFLVSNQSLLAQSQNDSFGTKSDEVVLYSALSNNTDISLSRINLSDSTFEQLIRNNYSSIRDLRIDHFHRKLYFVDEQQKQIVRTNLDGSEFEVVLFTHNSPRHLALDQERAKIYWVETVDIPSSAFPVPAIRTAGLDGSSVTTLFTQGREFEASPKNLTIDPSSGDIFLSASSFSSGSVIYRCHLATVQCWPIIERPGLTTYGGELAIDPQAGHIYWTENDVVGRPAGRGFALVPTGGLYRARLDGTFVERVQTGEEGTYFRTPGIDANQRTLYFMQLDLPFLLPGFDDAGGSLMRTPLLPNALPEEVISPIDGDGKAVDFLAQAAFGEKIAYPSIVESIGRYIFGSTDSEDIIVPRLSTVYSLTVDRSRGKIYWVDTQSANIVRANLNGSQAENILVDADAVHFSPASNKLYFNNKQTKMLERSDPDGANREVLFQVGDSFADLILDEEQELIYWIAEGSILRANLDGSNQEIIETSGPSHQYTKATLAQPLNKICWFARSMNPASISSEIQCATRETLQFSKIDVISSAVTGSLVYEPSRDRFYLGYFGGVSWFSSDGSSNSDILLFQTPWDLEASSVQTIHSLWNGFLNLNNILELVNRGPDFLHVSVTLYSIDGEKKGQIQIGLAGHEQFDVLVNLLQGFTVNSYGIVKIRFSGPQAAGRMLQYRPDRTGTSTEFAFALPLVAPLKGTSFVNFNTFQPSLAANERNHLVSQWLSLVNLDATSDKAFTVLRYDQFGSLIYQETVLVPAFGRIDIEGGHLIPGINYVGLNKIVPADSEAPYLAKLIRYGGNAPSDQISDSFSFAYPLLAQQGQTEEFFMPISSGGGADNWLELSNILDEEITVAVNIIGQPEAAVIDPGIVLLPYQQVHLEVGSLLPEGASGVVRISSNKERSVLAQSAYYFRGPRGEIQAMYASPARSELADLQVGSYNLYLNQFNWLRLANVSNETSEIKLTLHTPQGPTVPQTILLEPLSSLDLGLHDFVAFGTSPDTYGQVVLEVDRQGSLLADLLRVKTNLHGFEFVLTTTVE